MVRVSSSEPAGRARSRNQKNPFRRRDDMFLTRLLRIPAERAGKLAPRFGDLPQAAHRFADQRDRRNAQMIRQRSVRAHDSPRPIVHHDVIADRVDILYPLPLRSLQLRKSPEILQRQRRMARQRMQQAFRRRPARLLRESGTDAPRLSLIARGDRHKRHISNLSSFSRRCRQ